MKNTRQEIELELAWLVASLPNNLGQYKNIKIVQAYLENSDPHIKDARVREKG